MIPNKFVAIDFGSTRISVMAAEVQSDGFLKILGVESKPSEDIRYGIIEQGSGAAFKLSELLRMLENSAKLRNIDYLSVSVGAKSMKNVQVSVSKFVGASKTVSPQLLQTMTSEAEAKVKGENVAVYDVVPLYFELDGMRTVDPTGKQASQITGKYNIIYGNKIIAEKLEGCMERTGKTIEFRCLGIEAVATAVLDEHEREEGCALINLGGQTTTLAIYRDGAMQNTIVMPMGGMTITHDIEEFGISDKNAERLKCAVGKALESQVEKEVLVAVPSIDPNEPQVKIPTKTLSMAIEARLDEILGPIFTAISAYPAKLPHGIILTGGASALSGLAEYVSLRTGHDVRFGDYFDWITDDVADDYRNNIYTQLVGTILLNKEYREIHPLTESDSGKKTKPPKIPGSGLRIKTTELFKDFFSDDNTLE